MKATGLWHIYFFDIAAIRQYQSGVMTGNGDDVFAVLTPHGRTARIEGNYTNRYFGITAYTVSNQKLLVNTTKPYSGKVLIGAEFMIVDVRAVGDWSFSVE